MTAMTEDTKANEISINLIPLYFGFKTKELIKAKSLTLSKIKDLELELLDAEHDLAYREMNLILETDFKALKLTNEKMRNAYINKQLFDERCDIDVKKYEISSKKDELKIINDLIRLNELECEGE